MEEKQRWYAAIDLKSFYASVECHERGMDPMSQNLVVADESRTEKTICLAVSPALKSYGVGGRPRLFEVVQRVREINSERLRHAPGHKFTGKSCNINELKAHPELELDYVVAVPRMQYYMNYSTMIYNIYLKYIAPEDIHVYSIDEVFIDVTSYLKLYQKTPRELTMMLIREVMSTTGITATAGIGTNLYLCKVAMDIVAKHIPADQDGVRIAELNERQYRIQLWDHRPLTDFWRIGGGYSRKLQQYGMYTMGDIARCSLEQEDLLYQLFGINAELLIDHAWGYEPTRMSDIKAYRPKANSVSTGQVLPEPYTFEKGRLIAKEMAEQLAMDLFEKGLVTDQIVLTVNYDSTNLDDPNRMASYHGPMSRDMYGRYMPKHAHGSVNLKVACASATLIMEAVTRIYDEKVNPGLLVRRFNICANRIGSQEQSEPMAAASQMDLFTDYQEEAETAAELEKERKLQEAMITLKNRFGKNTVLRGMNLEDGAMTLTRNDQIGGHKA